MCGTYLVGLVVVLRVVFKDLGAFRVIEVSNQVVNTSVEFLPPFLAVEEPVISY